MIVDKCVHDSDGTIIEAPHMTCTRARTNFYFSVAVSASSVKNNFIKAELKMLLFIRFSFEINTFSLLPSSEFNFSRTSLINIPGDSG